MPRVLVSPNIKDNLLHLEQDYVFYFSGKTYLIEKDFEWDGASIPRFFWRLVGGPFVPQFWRASLEHDYFCWKRPDDVPYDLAAQRFYNVLIEDGVSSFKAGYMKQAVLFGGPKWGYSDYDD